MADKGKKRKRDDSILDITPIDDVTKRHPPVAHPVLLQHPYSLLEVAPPGAGKTTLLVNQIIKQYKGYFHDIHVWSPTIEADPKWRKVKDTKEVLARNKRLEKMIKGINAEHQKPKLDITKELNHANMIKHTKPTKKTFDGKIPKKNFHRKYAMADLVQWMDKQEKTAKDLMEMGLNEEEAACTINRTLHVFDDMVGSDLFQQSKKNNAFLELNVRRRHFNTSIIMVTQGYKEIPKTDRICVSGLVLYRISNPAEVDCIYEEHPCDLDADTWLRVYRKATAGKHDFLYVNYQLSQDHQRATMFRNFKTKLNTDELVVGIEDMVGGDKPDALETPVEPVTAVDKKRKRDKADSAAGLGPKKYKSK